MKTKLIAALDSSLSALCFFIIMLMVAFPLIANEQCEIYNSLPPQYGLEKNQYGKYRPIHTGDGNRPLIWLQDDGTRCEAIERAWLQYLYEKKEAAKKWVKSR